MKNSLKLSFAVLSLVAILGSSCKEKVTPPVTSTTIDRNDLKGTFTSDVNLTDGTYKLTGPLVIDAGATLNISAGVIIEDQGGGTGAYVAIKQGGKINAVGTSSNPVVFTSINKSQASWGGIVVCGKAPINKGASAQAEVTSFIYGGTDAHDNSGNLKYVRVEYSGAKINGDKEFNGITFFGVGDGTTVDYLQSFVSSDDGIECFGGTVVLNHIICINSEDDAFDWTEGWSGAYNYAYASVKNIKNASDDSRGIEADNWDGGFAINPVSNPTISNISLVARDSATTSGAQKEGVKLRRGTHGNFSNIYVKGYSTGINIEHDETISWFYPSASLLYFANYQFDMVSTLAKTTTTDKSSSGGSAAVTLNISSSLTNGTSLGAGNGATFPTWGSGWAREI